MRVVQQCGLEVQQEMQRFPKLYERINEIVSSLLIARLQPTKRFVKDIVHSEVIGSPPLKRKKIIAICLDGLYQHQTSRLYRGTSHRINQIEFNSKRRKGSLGCGKQLTCLFH